MKHFNLLALILLFPFFLLAQEYSVVNVGVGIPGFFQPNFDANSGGTHSIGSNRINLTIEKPHLFEFKQNTNIAITPGLGYFVFNESGSGGGLGGGNSKIYKHQALSLYTKILYEKELNVSKSFNMYGGILSGVYFFTKTTGKESWWAIQQTNTRSGSTEIDRNGKNFFHSVYMGFLVGIRPNIPATPFFKPVMEISFLPNYATIINSNLSIHEQQVSKNMAMISIIIGFGTKKRATQINE